MDAGRDAGKEAGKEAGRDADGRDDFFADSCRFSDCDPS